MMKTNRNILAIPLVGAAFLVLASVAVLSLPQKMPPKPEN